MNKMNVFNRMVIILAIVALAGWLAFLKIDPEAIVKIIMAVSTPAGIYIGVKGLGK